MAYTVRKVDRHADGQVVEIRKSGSVVLSVNCALNPRLAGSLCTPLFHDNPAAQVIEDGVSTAYVNALAETGGKWAFDLATKRLSCVEAGVDEVVKVDEDRDEILAGINAVKALFPGRDDAWAKAYLKFHRQFDLYNAG